MRAPSDLIENAASRGLRMRFAWRRILLLLAMGIQTIAYGAESSATLTPPNYFVRNWRVDDGLPHNSVNRIVQDQAGFLWIATLGGLARFDGREFREYTPPLAPADANYNIRDLALEDDNTLVMLPASGGVARLRDGVFSEHPASDALAGRQLLFLFPEPGGALWTVSGPELIRWENGKTSVFGPADGVNRRGQRPSFAVDGRGRVWVAAGDFLGWLEQGRLRRFAGDFGAFVTIAPAQSGGLWIATTGRLLKMEGDTVRTIVEGAEWTDDRAGLQELHEDRAGGLLIGSRRFGLSRWSQGSIRKVRTSHEQAESILEDTQGNIWVSSRGGGIDRLRRHAFVVLDSAGGLPDEMSTSVAGDGAGGLWLANRSGGLVNWRAGQIRRIARPSHEAELYANAVCPDRDGNLWVATTRELYRIGPGADAELRVAARNLRNVHVLFCARNGDVWVGAADARFGFFRAGVFHPLRTEDGYDGRLIKAVAENSQGAIFVANDRRQLFEVVDGKLVQRIGRAEMPGGLIHALHFDGADRLWIGTSHGLVLRRGANLQRLSTGDGLPDDLVSQILEDNHGRLWCGSRRGPFSVALADLVAVADGKLDRVHASTLGPDEGLRGASALDGMQPMAWKGEDGRVWFSTHVGVVGIDPAAALPPDTPPRVIVDEVLVDGVTAASRERISFLSKTRQVEFRVVALNYSAPEKVRLRHRLENYDFDWIETGTERHAIYSHLPPGDYTFRVTASHQDGRWNPAGAGVALQVIPAWWQTVWARGLLVAAFTGLVGGVARYWSHRRLRARLRRLEYEHALEKERARIARDLHDDLGSSLTQIGMLADRLKRQPGESDLKPGLGQLAWRTRRLAGDLESIVWTVSPKNNTWDRLALFVGQYARGFFRDTNMQCDVTGEDIIPALPLEPDAQHHVLAVLREALNNVLKHARATSVTVTMTAAGGKFNLRIVDNGVGFNPTAPEHAERNGLNNMRSRAAELGGALEIRSARDAGTEIQLGVKLAAPATTKS